MSDPLYLSLWFPDFSGPEMLPHTFAVLQQFPFSAQRPGISYFAVHPISWDEATVLERRFPSGIDPGQATLIAAELVHDDYAYVFEAHWDLWTPDESNANWVLEPATVKFIVQGEEFDEGSYQQTGHIEVDFGLDSYFLQPETSLSDQTRAKIRDNVAKLVEFSVNVATPSFICQCTLRLLRFYFVLPPSSFSVSEAPACAAASRAVSTRNGEHET